jgi:chromosome segregation ATPase
MEYLGVAEMIVTLLSIAAGFAYKTIMKNMDDAKEEINMRVNKLEETLQQDDTSIKEELSTRIDKFEENSRRDDDGVKDLIKEAESRMHGEISARIRNIVDLHTKIEQANSTLTTKHENVLDRISKVEGQFGTFTQCFDSSKYK